MASALPNLGVHSVVVSLPDIEADELVPICEVLCQEGFKLWAVTTDRVPDLPALLRVFGRRARIGVQNVTAPEQVVMARDAGAAFAASAYLLPDLVSAAPDLPVILGGLTPSELHAGASAGAAAVQIVPTEAFGTSYSRTLPGMVSADLIATGRLERYQAELWLESGAVAVWPHDLIGRELISGDSLDPLRVKLQQWRLGD